MQELAPSLYTLSMTHILEVEETILPKIIFSG
jgi:hypothetical protein